MACIFMDGFDYYATADIGKRWTSSSAATIAPTAARAPSGQGMSVGNGNASKSLGSNYVSGCFGFAVLFSSGTIATRGMAVVLDGATEQISVRTNASSVLTVTRNGTVLATGTTVLSSGVWYYIELKFTINASTGVVELHLNGATEIASTSSLNTRNTANTQWNGIQLNAGSGQTSFFDDVYVLDTSTGSNTTFLGPVRAVALYPSAPGNYAQWTPNGGTNEGCVSEMFEDGDTSFNQSSTASQIDSFAMQDLPTSSGSVFAVQHVNTARQDAGAARTMAPLARISGTDYVGTTVSLSTSYQILTQIYDQSPATSSAWGLSEVNGMEAGYKLIS